ncbi:uncharacterized protein N7500_004889 [Penicillium coprophilum]|uniref:uncharacterized protein n=1 Tax=Penicillium coprophilum TaxID=36646 RepID=UPI00238637E9|nr:uncharacterized protein N7500_004889 [Penicillium coprophilum]KAJ5163059.1 hypothetical protein N7500_004889 [Penicillium coprophilum]
MSADLLAEFGQAPAPDKRSRQQPLQHQKHSFFDADDSIDFFGPTGSVQHNKRPNPTQEAHNQFTTPAASWQSPDHQEFGLPLNPHSDVLFDAEFDTPASDADDDWGEFEGPNSNTLHAQPIALRQSDTVTSLKPEPRREDPQVSRTVDLLDSLSMPDSAPVVKHPSKIAKNQHLEPNNQEHSAWEDDSFGDWGDFADVPASQPPPKVSKKKAKAPIRPIKSNSQPASTWGDEAFDDWGDFSDGPSVKPALKSKPTSPPTAPGPAPSSSVSGITATVRPTNIPPPSVLLELFLDVFENLQKEAALAKSQPRSSAPSSSSNTISTTAMNIHNVLQSAARVIAGRSLRWKRDTILSQSMRIGPARSGKAGGMKLNSVNKQENIKEEQDAVDVLTTWRERAASFNAVLQAASLRPIPTVSDPSALKVITARADQGALKASHPCALCSLKRDERVLRVDEQSVQDSFGEWWTEHWGHTACRQFWETNRKLLGQR